MTYLGASSAWSINCNAADNSTSVADDAAAVMGAVDRGTAAAAVVTAAGAAESDNAAAAGAADCSTASGCLRPLPRVPLRPRSPLSPCPAAPAELLTMGDIAAEASTDVVDDGTAAAGALRGGTASGVAETARGQ